MPTWKIDFSYRLDMTNPELVTNAARVESLAKVIHGIPLPPAVQFRIDRLNILRAVRGTTGIEGTEVSETEVSEIMAAGPQQQVLPPSRRRAEQEVRNAREVMDYVANVLRGTPDQPVTEELVRKLHELTTKDIDYPNNEPGRYRNHAVQAGTYVPPRTGDEVRALMEEFVEWLRTGPSKAWPAPIRAIAAHFYLISIHPFGDGNGRTARGLESFLLYQGGINARGFYSLSNFYYLNRPEYIDMLDFTRFKSKGDLTPFVRFALEGLVAEQEAVHEEILNEVTIIAFRDYARETLSTQGKLATDSGQRMFMFLLGLAEGSVEVSQLRRGGHHLSTLYRDVTTKTISRDLNYLRKHNLITVEGNVVSANIDRMRDFMPFVPNEPEQPSEQSPGVAQE